ncbi:serine hydrolase [Nocardioides sp. zg-DK7169]|uniref:serine hydrolase domain-containing protein n=1 Tax=Nocardioides sp. zg-DK7169 TaxID=2736600 RepID=UPI0015541EEE|nr:serine hydrolase [Nocardioides sp. zg-DK7169]NPC95201.1 serine hydrolase [Nocardioides sp. zg-DK7169]
MRASTRPRTRLAAAVTSGVLLLSGAFVGQSAAQAAEAIDPDDLRAQVAALTTKADAAEHRAAAAATRATRAAAKAEVLVAQATAARTKAKQARTRAVAAAEDGRTARAEVLRQLVAEHRARAERTRAKAVELRASAKQARVRAGAQRARHAQLLERAAELSARADALENRAANESLLAETLAGWNIPGAQVVHTKAGVSDSYTYGVQSTATGVEVDEHSLFQGASLTKVVASYLFLKRVDEGVIDLDTPLWEYFESPRTVESDLAKKITARMVLNHTTGLPNWVNGAGREDNQLVPAWEPGTRFGYSGEGFFLLQRTIEHLDGQPLAQTLEEEVFAPLGMADTTLATRPEDAPRTTVGHGADGAPVAMSNYVPGNAAYTLQTTARDYDRFIQRALFAGEGLSAETHALWTEVSSDAQRDANPADRFIDWGLGVGLQTSAKGKALWHWGDNGSRRAFFLAFPETGESVVMFFNSVNGQKAAGSVLSQFLGPQAHHAVTWVG